MEQIEGIVVRTIRYQENSKIASVLTPTGLYSYLLKGANTPKAKNYAYSQPITLIRFAECKSKSNDSMKIMGSGEVLNNFNATKMNSKKMYAILIVFEYIINFANHINDNDTFYNFTKSIIEQIDENDSSEYYSVIFRLKLLYLLGVGPIFTKCVRCGSKENFVGFDFLSGGMICSKCSDNNEKFYAKDIVEIVKYLYLKKPFELFGKTKEINDKALIAGIDRFLKQYYESYLSFDSKCIRIIKYIDQ